MAQRSPISFWILCWVLEEKKNLSNPGLEEIYKVSRERWSGVTGKKQNGKLEAKDTLQHLQYSESGQLYPRCFRMCVHDRAYQNSILEKRVPEILVIIK